MSELDAVMENDLRALDEALEASVATAADRDERALQELALALAAEAPEPQREFAEELDERVRAGFRRERRLLSWPRLRRPLPAVLWGATTVATALVVTVALVGGSESEQDERGTPASRIMETSGQRTAKEPAASARVPSLASSGGDLAPNASGRRIERSASLTLAAPGADIDAVSERIAAVTDRLRGFVLSSSVSTGEDGDGGRFELRVPADKLQVALKDLSALADVRSRTQTGQDITRVVQVTEGRLDVLRAERRSLLRRLERAGTDAEAEAIRRRLDLNAGQIRDLRRQVRDLRIRTGYATVSVTLERATEDSSDNGLGGALDDAMDSLGDSAEIVVRVVGVALPLALLGALGWGAARLAIRRRREAALS